MMMMSLTMFLSLMIPEGLNSSKCGNHDNYIVDNEDVVDVDVNDDT